jgi:hypothetical protein
MEIPTIDGHFWVVRNGQIVDTNFPEYDIIRKIRGCEPATMSYLPAPKVTQKIMTLMFHNTVKKLMRQDDWDKCMKEVIFVTHLAGIKEPQCYNCYQNCIIEIYHNGGELVFGSMGFKKTDGTIWWEFGGENYTTVKDFRRPNSEGDYTNADKIIKCMGF